MTTESGYGSRRRGGGIARVVGILVVLWLIIGAIAAGQRHYYSSGDANCASVTTTIVTIIAGPLNYVGANPKEQCPKVNVPQPSK